MPCKLQTFCFGLNLQPIAKIHSVCITQPSYNCLPQKVAMLAVTCKYADCFHYFQCQLATSKWHLMCRVAKCSAPLMQLNFIEPVEAELSNALNFGLAVSEHFLKRISLNNKRKWLEKSKHRTWQPIFVVNQQINKQLRRMTVACHNILKNY